MDSISQFVLGAAIGQACFGKKNNGKGALLGGVGATLPDLDFLAVMNSSIIDQLIFHRGFSHSLLFCIFIPFLFAWLSKRLLSFKATYKHWYFFWFLIFSTHVIFDLMTSWGTQIFWPAPNRISLNSWFIVDPLVSLPLIIGIIIYKLKRSSKTLYFVFAFCSAYIAFSLSMQFWMTNQFKSALAQQNISYEKLLVRPTPFNTLYWTTTIKTYDDSLIMAYSRIWDSANNITFKEPIKQNSHYLRDYLGLKAIQQLFDITHGYYVIEASESNLIVHDARYGVVAGWINTAQEFLFSFSLDLETGVWKQEREEVADMGVVMRALFKQIIE